MLEVILAVIRYYLEKRKKIVPAATSIEGYCVSSHLALRVFLSKSLYNMFYPPPPLFPCPGGYSLSLALSPKETEVTEAAYIQQMDRKVR